MRSHDPIILREVRRSVLESLLVFALFLCILKISAGAQSKFARDLYNFLDIESKWRIHCAEADPKDWGQYCHWLKLRIKPDPVIFAIRHFVAAIVSASLLSCVCAELLLEIHARSFRFQEWYWDEYNLQWRRVMAHGG